MVPGLAFVLARNIRASADTNVVQSGALRELFDEWLQRPVGMDRGIGAPTSTISGRGVFVPVQGKPYISISTLSGASFSIHLLRDTKMRAPTPRPQRHEISRRRYQRMAEIRELRERMINGEVTPTGTIRRSRMFEVFSHSRESIADAIDEFGTREHALAALEGRMASCPEHFNLNERRIPLFSRVKPKFKVSRQRARGMITKLLQRRVDKRGPRYHHMSRGWVPQPPIARWQSFRRQDEPHYLQESVVAGSSVTLLSFWSEGTNEDEVYESPPQLAVALPNGRFSTWFTSMRSSVSRRKSSAANSIFRRDGDALDEHSLDDRSAPEQSGPGDLSQRPREATFLRRASDALLSGFGRRKRNDSSGVCENAKEEADEKSEDDLSQAQAKNVVERHQPLHPCSSGQNVDFSDSNGGMADMLPELSLRDDDGIGLNWTLCAGDVDGAPF